MPALSFMLNWHNLSLWNLKIGFELCHDIGWVVSWHWFIRNRAYVAQLIAGSDSDLDNKSIDQISSAPNSQFSHGKLECTLRFTDNVTNAQQWNWNSWCYGFVYGLLRVSTRHTIQDIYCLSVYWEFFYVLSFGSQCRLVASGDR